ncbi:MAG: hypothetical protein EBU61_05875 [Crocinitomicaceae bacterium]|nr:hypothetical protein [Crocinitomicaceae bacterium]
MRNLAECTKLGGYFIGTTIDGEKTQELLSDKVNQTHYFDDGYIQLQQDGTVVLDVKGTIVERQVESLVNFKRLEWALKEVGIVLKESKFFPPCEEELDGNEQILNSTQKYLVGSYDVEIFTLPRTYKTIEITQSKTTTINVVASGTLNYTAEKGLIGQIFTDKGDQTFEWVCDLKEGFNKDLWNLQPGSYKVIYREKDQKSIAYTKEKNFKIESNKSISLNL